VARTAIVHRRVEQGIEVLETTLPALLTVEKEIAAIARAPCPTWSAPPAIDPRPGTPSRQSPSIRHASGC
jgi:electron transfer flavoprotein beta subunit